LWNQPFAAHICTGGRVSFWLTAILSPLIGNILLIADIAPREVDPMPFALLLTSMLLWWSVYRYYLFDLSPVASNIFVDIMPNGMLAIDGRGRIIDINQGDAGPDWRGNGTR
jgi:hypothetical protein